MFSRYTYIPLLTNSEPDSVEHDLENHDAAIGQRNVLGLRRTVNYTLAATLLCVVVNLGLVCYRLQIGPFSTSAPVLEFANAYMGLDMAVRDPNAPPFPPISSFPVASGLVNQSSPTTVYFEAHDRKTFFGTISPTRCHVRADDTVSTILQFWSGDFGMERCVLKLKLSLTSSTGDTAGPIQTAGPATRLQVYRLQSPRPLDLRKLSYADRPKRGALLAQWGVFDNEMLDFTSHEFACPSGTFQTFEIACSNDDGCLFDFWQTPDALSGIRLVQESSL